MDLRVDRSSPLPLGAQLEGHLRRAIEGGELGPGDQLPSLRHVAAEAGVNVNTVRAMYTRLEAAGVVITEQGRGTFAAAPSARVRRELRKQIERLEAELVRLPPPHPGGGTTGLPSGGGAGLLSTADLAAIRDELLQRLHTLDAARAEVVKRLERLEDTEAPSAPAPAASPTPARHSSPTRIGARVRWVGA
jgi:DNA-binding transcriptional regulator YhcF (GntR family)